MGLREWGIHQYDDCHRVGSVYYIRVWDEAQATESCTFTVVYRITRSPATQLYKGKQVGFTSKSHKMGIAYYRVNIPKEDFVDVTYVFTHSLTLSITHSLVHSLIHSFTLSFTHSLNHSLVKTHSPPT